MLKRFVRILLVMTLVTSMFVAASIQVRAETIEVEGRSVTYVENDDGTTNITFSKDGVWTNQGQELEFKYADGSDFIQDTYVRDDNGDITVTTKGSFDIDHLIVAFGPDGIPRSSSSSSGRSGNDVISTTTGGSSGAASSDNSGALFFINESNASGTPATSSDSGSSSDISSNIEGMTDSNITFEELNSDKRRAIEGRMTYSAFTYLCSSAASEVPEGGTLNINTGKWVSIDKKTMEVIASRPDMAVIINYIYKGKGYSVTIPAGYDVMSLLDENGYCGFLYLGSIFGTTELK